MPNRRTLFSKFAETCSHLEKASSKKAKVQIITEFMRGLHPNEISIVARFFIGQPSIKGALEIGPSTLMRMNVKYGQKSLIEEKLSIFEVAEILEKITSLSGGRSKKARERLLTALFSKATEHEREYLYRLISKEMRLGVEEGVMLDSLALLSNQPIDLIRRSFMLTQDIGELAEISAITPQELEKIVITPFKPIRPMMAEMVYSVQDILKAHKNGSILEFKFDGARVQVHKLGDKVKVFSRRLLDVTENLPDLVKRITQNIKETSTILDGELIAVNGQGKPLPFQDLMRRFKRIESLNKMIEEIPVKLYVFDILYLNGKDLLNETYLKRRELLESTVPEEFIPPSLRSDKPSVIKSFMQKSMREGHEGVMAKAVEGRYHMGSRGKVWLKVKPVETLDVVIKAADWGHGRRKGWLSNYHLAVLSKETGEFISIGKTFKGLTDRDFKQMTERLLSVKIHEEDYTVYVRPEVVVEVAFNEIQKSPFYRSGYALRFARIKKIRDDKSPNEADTLSKVHQIYENQFKFKGKLKMI